jgi:dinuclear metal center YbgI/SA1388 family protein
MPTVKDFHEKINLVAPFKAAYQWDNVGLLIGDMNAMIDKVLLTLDITDSITDYAIKHNIDLIVSHHPLMMQGVKSITQRKLLNLIENKIAVISAHTNLDVSKYGVNYTLANRLGLSNIQPLSMSNDIKQYQVSVYTPEDALSKVLDAMHVVGAGVIGNYSHCATYFETSGQYKPLENSNPYHGEMGTLEKVKEIKLEVICEEINLQKTIQAMLQTHPYETPVYTVVELKQLSQNYGLGCYGDIESDLTLYDLSQHTKIKLNAPFVKLWTAGKSQDTIVKRIAVCGGSGNSIIHEAKQKADVFVSSDFTYHQLLDAPLPVIDAGHFFTENPVIYTLKDLFSELDCEIVLATELVHDVQCLKII